MLVELRSPLIRSGIITSFSIHTFIEADIYFNYLRYCMHISSDMYGIFLVQMARLNDWKYNTEENFMVKQPGNTTEFPPLPRMKLKLSSAGKSITIKVKSEALTPANNLQHTHDTGCKRRLTIEPQPLKPPNYDITLSILSPIVPSPTKSPPIKKLKSGEHFVG